MIDGTFFSDRSLHVTRATLMVFVYFAVCVCQVCLWVRGAIGQRLRRPDLYFQERGLYY
jgi:hypothetical protein